MLRRTVHCAISGRMAWLTPSSVILARISKALPAPLSPFGLSEADDEANSTQGLPRLDARSGRGRSVALASDFMLPNLSSSTGSFSSSTTRTSGGGRGGNGGMNGGSHSGRPRRAISKRYADGNEVDDDDEEGEALELNVTGPVVTPFADVSGGVDTAEMIDGAEDYGDDAYDSAALRAGMKGRSKKSAALAGNARRLVVPPRPQVSDAHDMDSAVAPSTSHGGLEDADDMTDVRRGTLRQGKTSSSSKARSVSNKSMETLEACGEVNERLDTEEGGSTSLEVPNALSNPFLGLHDLMARSYRLDQLIHQATEHDLLFARQERKSTAFSFLRVRAGTSLYEQHWASLPQLHSLLSSLQGSSSSSSKAIPGLSLFNNDLGLANLRVQSSYPLIVAQRLLLFPDHVRHFHTLCGREDVPCDFYADVDLDGESATNGERILLEILNYLEVRLPGIGFTDPFFLVLANEVPSADKVSFHIHARSMTYLKERAEMPLSRRDLGVVRGGSSGTKSRRGSRRSDAATSNEDEDDLHNDTTNTKASSASSSSVPKVIAFQDYRAVKLLADEVNQTLGRNVIDDHCYRAHGMLRCAFSAKLNSNQNLAQRNRPNDPRRRLMPLLRAKDCALQDKLSAMESVLRTMTDPEILELSFVNRYLDEPAALKRVHEHVKTLFTSGKHEEQDDEEEREALLRATARHRFKLVRPRHITGPQGAQAQEYDSYGNVVSPFLTEAAKWRRYKTVVAKLRALPPRAAEPYDVWVRVGLALHNFSNEDHVFDEWVRFSLKCPQKYSREMCRRKWVQFERNPDALNWRRGFNYLNSTVWRQV